MSFNGSKPETISRMECQFVRDFSASTAMIMDQFERFQRTGTLSHSILRELLGVSDNRGSLWRLKDVTHLLFSGPEHLCGQLLDRTIGTIFHEIIKLLESTYLSQHYAQTCKVFISRNLGCDTKDVALEMLLPLHRDLLCGVAGDLLTVLEECSRDVLNGMERLGKLCNIARPLICICFIGKSSNHMLVKYLEGRKNLVERVMGSFYEEFIRCLDLVEPILPTEKTRFTSRFALNEEE